MSSQHLFHIFRRPPSRQWLQMGIHGLTLGLAQHSCPSQVQS